MNEAEIAAIVYVARKLHWSRKEIGKLSPAQFKCIYDELQFQEASEEYVRQYNVASILASIANTVPRKSNRSYKAKDFLKAPMPQRSLPNQGETLEELAMKYGLSIPASEIKSLGG